MVENSDSSEASTGLSNNNSAPKPSSSACSCTEHKELASQLLEATERAKVELSHVILSLSHVASIMKNSDKPSNAEQELGKLLQEYGEELQLLKARLDRIEKQSVPATISGGSTTPSLDAITRSVKQQDDLTSSTEMAAKTCADQRSDLGITTTSTTTVVQPAEERPRQVLAWDGFKEIPTLSYLWGSGYDRYEDWKKAVIAAAASHPLGVAHLFGAEHDVDKGGSTRTSRYDEDLDRDLALMIYGSISEDLRRATLDQFTQVGLWKASRFYVAIRKHAGR
ncbi:hypothetical protein A4X09_0g7640 [Tilletia walkeri]|uniref:Uncharacterized protein n=1 Tax=Tilletia walkeri TaxID=117179 RepID=A0A8X7N2U3_9BASI|nr:hypothetical protein A4X09_0g7640 [Tilletia walkeri]